MCSLIRCSNKNVARCLALIIIMPIICCSDTKIGLLYPDNEIEVSSVKVGPPAHNYEHEAGSYGDGFT